MKKSTPATMKKLSIRLLSLVLAAVLFSGCVHMTLAATPSSTSNASATLAYTLKGLPLGRAVQNFYVGATYIYITQRVDATTYLSRLKINGNTATYVDRMTFTNCGHGQSLDFYSYGGKEYFYMGCKAETATTYNWSVQIARLQYEAGKTYDYTDLNRMSYMNYANKTLARLGTTYRVACGVNGNYTIFRIQTEEGTVTYSGYNTTKLNALLDAGKSVRMDTADAKAACSFSFTQSGTGIIRPNGSFQGIDMSSTKSIYLSGGAHGETPQIARMNSSGSYLKLIKVSNVGALEIEGVQCKGGKVYFTIVPGTTAAEKKDFHKIYYIKESTFGISHTITTVAGKAPTCTSTGLSEGSKCTTCSQPLDVQEILPKLDHTVVNVPEVPASCTTGGTAAGTKCSVCNTILSGCTAIAPLGHSPEEIPGVEVTCTSDGMTPGSKCAVCQELLSGGEVIEATGHKAVEVPAIEGNCLTEGRTAGTKCELCDTVLTGCEVIEAAGHSVRVIEGTAASCLNSGLTEGEVCSLCGEVLKEQVIVPRLGHDYSYVSNGDTHTASCSRCDKVSTTAHSYVDGACVCGAREQGAATVDSSIAMNHTLNLASDISLNYAIKAELLKDYVNHYLVCEIPVYEGSTRTGIQTVTIAPVLNGGYYYYTLNGLTAVQMGDVVEAWLHMERDGQDFVSQMDSYSISQYAYSQLEKTTASQSLKTLCADLLRYGALAQTYKGYRTDSLADGALTGEQESYLSPLEAVSFGDCNETLSDLDAPVIIWAGKALDLNSKVSLKYVFDASSYTGAVEDLELRVTYVDHEGKTATATVTEVQGYDASTNRYAFVFDGLLAAELRTVVEAAVYEGSTRLSQTLRYSADTYGNGKSGDLLRLCKGLFAYSDSAKAYFG